jgi:antitoxin VapB
MSEARIFKVGGSQAVRLPKAFRFRGDWVRIRKEGEAVILEPVERSPDEIRAWLDSVRIAGFMPEGREQPAPQTRDDGFAGD